jgi:methylenetetrahydrofolate dehydrogenase (NADP+) / methenyltetrahydrofolate cyclohydrolase
LTAWGSHGTLTAVFQTLAGKIVAEEVYRKVLLDLSLLAIVPKLVVVLVGEDPGSQVYVRSKRKKCLDLGMQGETVELPAATTEEELVQVIRKLNNDDSVTGILVQLPLPENIQKMNIFREIAPEKDVDGLNPENVGLLTMGVPRFQPCTPSGVIEILKYYQIPIEGKRAVVLGRSEIVGRPMAQLLLMQNATVTLCHSKTQDLIEETCRADILVVAVGRPKFIKAEHIRKGATVIDVGIHRLEGGLCGDVDPKSVENQAGALTPVPGGVGPMTIAMLMRNVLLAANLQARRKGF